MSYRLVHAARYLCDRFGCKRQALGMSDEPPKGWVVDNDVAVYPHMIRHYCSTECATPPETRP